MEIEIITTKKKLSKNILNQLKTFPFCLFPLKDQYEVLGFINLKPRIILIKYENKYYTLYFLPLTKEGTLGLKYKNINNIISVKYFKTENERDDVYFIYNNIMEKAKQTQIFI